MNKLQQQIEIANEKLQQRDWRGIKNIEELTMTRRDKGMQLKLVREEQRESIKNKR